MSNSNKKIQSISDVYLFFAESFNRWGEKSPKHARVWRSVNWIFSAIAGIPFILIQLGVVPSPTWAKIILGIVAFSGGWGGAMNTLTVSKPSPEIMPFTEKKQIEQEIKNERNNLPLFNAPEPPPLASKIQ